MIIATSPVKQSKQTNCLHQISVQSYDVHFAAAMFELHYANMNGIAVNGLHWRHDKDKDRLQQNIFK